MKKLTPKEELFVAHYLVIMCPVKAAKLAGYAKTTAECKAHKWVSESKCPPNKRHVFEAIQKRQEKKLAKLDISADRILHELALIAFADMRDYVDLDTDGKVTVKAFVDMPEGASRVIAGVEDIRKILAGGEGDGSTVILDARFKHKLHDKLKALELLGKSQRLFVDVKEHQGGPFVIIDGDDD